MSARRTPILTAAVLAVAAVAAAQDAGTRGEAARAAREAKATDPTGSRGPWLERVLTHIEREDTFRRLFGPRDGVYIRLRGIPDGPGLAVGPAVSNSRLLGGAVSVSSSAAISMGRDTEVTGGLVVPRLRGSSVTLGVDASVSALQNERYFGGGMTSQRSDEVSYGFDRRQTRALATFDAAPWLRLTAGAGFLDARVSDGSARGVPGISAVFTPASAPALDIDRSQTFRVLSVAATADTRDVPGNPRSGGRYHAALWRYDAGAAPLSFTRMDVELEQHFSAWRRQRVLTLRSIASVSTPDAGDEVPFYLQRTLGGSRLMRGFVTDRFRDRQVVALQAEYGWDLMPFAAMVLFAEGGAVGRDWRALRDGGFQKDYGFGFRFGSARTVSLRTDVAFGSGEGTRITMRFGHAF